MHIPKWKKLIWKGGTILTMWASGKGKNYGENKKASGCQGLGKRERWTVRVQRIFKAVKLFCLTLKWWIHVNTVLKTHKCTELRRKCNIKYRLWVRMMCQHRVITYNKCTPLVQIPTIGNGGGGNSQYMGTLYIFVSILLWT